MQLKTPFIELYEKLSTLNDLPQVPHYKTSVNKFLLDNQNEYPAEANVDRSRDYPRIADLEQYWPNELPNELPGGIITTPEVICAILQKEAFFIDAIKYSEIEKHLKDSDWWLRNLLPVVSILQSIPVHSTESFRWLFSSRLLRFLNSWKLECYLANEYKDSAYNIKSNGGGKPDGQLYRGEPHGDDTKPDLTFDDVLTEVKITQSPLENAIYRYASKDNKLLHGADWLLLYGEAGEDAGKAVLVKNINDIKNGMEPELEILDKVNPTQYDLKDLLEIAPFIIREYIDMTIEWEHY